ncbi:hypothetical protein BRADI_1g02270v3 [Brachypodium distachyon]|uniref:Dipeptidylpeptidase IV N-terminal domain-containing protein n=2 Tax=Brachypodium distachyon TaxID=15368 RepID=A0A0Q3GP71_BRADI|nr:hypothetical protein BRADI_1g02270v3 [Brachypodium distachyon]
MKIKFDGCRASRRAKQQSPTPSVPPSQSPQPAAAAPMAATARPAPLLFHLAGALLLLLLAAATPALSAAGAGGGGGTIVFTTLGRSRYAFDIFAVPLNRGDHLALSPSDKSAAAEVRLTDGASVNYNGNFAASPSSDALLFVSERNGSLNLYLSPIPSSPTSRREALEEKEEDSSAQISPLLPWDPVALKDRPSLTPDGTRLVYVSTAVPAGSPRRSWAAVYSTELHSGRTRRLTPEGVADFSPAVSPSGEWTAVASPGEAGWAGEVEDLRTDIYVFRTSDGSRRTLVVPDGGWPCWADEVTLFFHRRDSDGWYGVYRAEIHGLSAAAGVVERITPPGFHAFTPAASPGAPGIVAVATRRPGSKYRHVEVIDLSSGGENAAYFEVTRSMAPHVHHFNPFISPDGARLGYHRCRGSGNGDSPLLLESLKSPGPDTVSLFRIDGSYPSFSHDGKRIAFVGLPGLYVVNSDGSSVRRKIFSGNAFPTSWDWKREGVIYTSIGPDFASESTEVDVVAVSLGDGESSQVSIKKLTLGGKNNAFPSPSPDGKWVVFRSGRSGHKNLYIMDAEDGEAGGIHRLTNGPWSDTMCNWSPDGEWIAFASDRHNPGGGSFAIYLIHPNGTGLRRLVHSADGGRTNHPWFSPDSKSIVFTSDLAAVSAEPISNPHHYQPYGEIFTINIDGSGLQRLTHNSFEDGTPSWTPYFLEPRDVGETLQASGTCAFNDCHWLDLVSQPADDGLRYAHGNKIGC